MWAVYEKVDGFAAVRVLGAGVPEKIYYIEVNSDLVLSYQVSSKWINAAFHTVTNPGVFAQRDQRGVAPVDWRNCGKWELIEYL